MKKIFANLLITIGYLCNNIALFGGAHVVLFGYKVDLFWTFIGVLIWLVPGLICLKIGRYLENKYKANEVEGTEEKVRIAKVNEEKNIEANKHHYQEKFNYGSVWVKIGISLLIVAFCLIVAGCVHGQEYYVNAFFYWPFYIIVMCYYLGVIWSKEKVTGERILMLPLLNKMGIYNDLKSAYDIRRKLVYNFAPILVLTITISSIVIVSYAYINDEYEITIGSVVLSIPVFLWQLFFLFAYGSKWISSKKNELNE